MSPTRRRRTVQHLMFCGEIAVDGLQRAPIQSGKPTNLCDHNYDLTAEIDIDVDRRAAAREGTARWTVFVADGVDAQEWNSGSD